MLISHVSKHNKSPENKNQKKEKAHFHYLKLSRIFNTIIEYHNQ